MKNENRAYVELANRLVEEFYKKQRAGLLSNLNKRNMDELEVSREKIIKTIRSELSEYESDSGAAITEEEKDAESMSREELQKAIAKVNKKMNQAAAELNFELAAMLRDELKELKITLRDIDA